MLFSKVSENLKLLKFSSSKFAIAVSGGPDSIALSFILRQLFPNAQIIILTVNHYLRNNVEKEIKFVEYFAKKLHADFYLLEWKEGKNQLANVESKAREARYNLMTKKCAYLSIKNLFIAHQQDDFIENYIIRKKRKSGILGLSTNYINFINDIRILRPLFNIYKKQIITFLNHYDIKYYEDISNHSDKYLRNRIRKTLIKSEEKKLQILKEIKNINFSAKIISAKLVEIIANAVKFFNSGFIVLNLNKTENIEKILKIQLFLYCITLVSSKSYTPRYRNIEKIIKSLEETNIQFFVRNLHGVVIEKTKSVLLIYKDYRNMIHKKESLQEIFSNTKSWDNRFIIRQNIKIFTKETFEHFSKDTIQHLNISSMYHFCKKYLTNKELIRKFVIFFIKAHNLEYLDLKRLTCKNILFTVPVIFDLEKCLIIPHINYGVFSEKFFKIFIFKPNFIFRFTHYSW